jgi:hypothetical protein
VTEPLPDIVREVEDPLVRLLVEHIDELERKLRGQEEVAAHWRARADGADRRVADLETERFAR